MNERNPNMPERVAAIADRGFATWASDDIDSARTSAVALVSSAT